MEKIILFLTVLCIAFTSCTKEKTDYEAEIDSIVPEQSNFKDAYIMTSGNFKIHVEALNGKLYKGYNEIRVKIDGHNDEDKVNASTVTFLPIVTHPEAGVSSCPHRDKLRYNPENGYFEGYVVFTEESNKLTNWDLQLSFSTTNQAHTAKQNITVQKQDNKNLNITSFTGRDDEQYIIALVAPQKPKVAENILLAGIYMRNRPTDTFGEAIANTPLPSYKEVQGYTLQLDPRMPESSMGNHSSPNNKDLSQGQDGLYQGVVNYTMTGNWTLNFILLNQHGRIIKGTTVPPDFTPGINGVKSELHIDILF